MMWYNREGQPISVEEAAPLLVDYNYKVIRRTVVGKMVVSTVWLGLDHSFGLGGPPIIFETMIFDQLGNDLAMVRYVTEQDAITGHAEMVKRAKEMRPQPVIRLWLRIHRR